MQFESHDLHYIAESMWTPEYHNYCWTFNSRTMGIIIELEKETVATDGSIQCLKYPCMS